MTKRERQGAILRLVRVGEVSTQGVLREALRALGIEVVQSTVSRDIAELGLVKVRVADGRLVYALPGSVDADRTRALGQALRRWAVSIEASGNLVVVTTPSGHADPLAQALDNAALPDVLGTLAGENAVFVAATEGVGGTKLRDELRHQLVLATR